jgi:hypothetical protein
LSIQLAVPFVTQLQIGSEVAGNSDAWDDRCGCWYASACMIGYFFEEGPRRGIPELCTMIYGEQLGHEKLIAFEDYRLLMSREGLKNIPESDKEQQYCASQIETLLASGGPILFYWNKIGPRRTYGHTSVVVGCDENTIFYHDSENHENPQLGGKNQPMTFAAFNRQRLFEPGVYGLQQRAELDDVEILTLLRKTVKNR